METLRKFERPNSRMERSLLQTLILFSRQTVSDASISSQSICRALVFTMVDDACHYDIQQNDKYGRYLVANKDLDGGDVIFTDSPFAVGPKPGKYSLGLCRHFMIPQHEMYIKELLLKFCYCSSQLLPVSTGN